MMVRRRTKEGDEGAVAVEFAIVLPILMLILFGIIQFGIAFSEYEVYTGAAREGARYAATRCGGYPDNSTTGCTPTMISTKVRDTSVGYSITPGTPTESVSGGASACSDSTIGQYVTVSWSQNITIDIPFWKTITATPTVSAVFRCE